MMMMIAFEAIDVQQASKQQFLGRKARKRERPTYCDVLGLYLPNLLYLGRFLQVFFIDISYYTIPYHTILQSAERQKEKNSRKDKGIYKRREPYLAKILLPWAIIAYTLLYLM